MQVEVIRGAPRKPAGKGGRVGQAQRIRLSPGEHSGKGLGSSTWLGGGDESKSASSRQELVRWELEIRPYCAQDRRDAGGLRADSPACPLGAVSPLRGNNENTALASAKCICILNEKVFSIQLCFLSSATFFPLLPEDRIQFKSNFPLNSSE